MNTERRKVARNAFEKDYFELMKNSIFGKTQEIVRGCNEIELVHTEKQMKKILQLSHISTGSTFGCSLLLEDHNHAG